MTALFLGQFRAVEATTHDGSGGELGGDDQYASGELLGDDAQVTVGDAGLGDESSPRQGGGNVVCRYWTEAGEPVNLRQLPPETHGQQVQIARTCEDTTTGDYLISDLMIVVPPAVPAADPEELATMARSRLPLPLPQARMNPDGEQTVNLASWLWVENWRPESRSATAGGVTAVVVATPVEQRWTFGSPDQRAVCVDAGKPYDLSKQPWQQSTTCSYTFRHSSAGEPKGVVQVKATLVWHVTWTSNIGASGDLGFVSRTTTIPTRVAEHQAINESPRR
ncbi:MAG TPA: hypothetical protein VF230_08825 [Acidimicrobiales bacterium]